MIRALIKFPIANANPEPCITDIKKYEFCFRLLTGRKECIVGFGSHECVVC